MKKVLKTLLNHPPNWVSIQKKSADRVEILAKPPIGNSGLECCDYNLELKANGSKVLVREIGEIKHLPIACPCRHINGDGSFCLGLDGGIEINANTSNDWWECVENFLKFQEVAGKTKIWQQYIDKNGRAYNELSHGNAAKYQLRAEKLASELGMLDCYNDSVCNRIDILATLPIHNKRNKGNYSQLKNGRAPCPRGCTKRGTPILRRNCSKKNTWNNFTKSEINRQIEAKKFVDAYGQPNCNLDMKYCEFRCKAKIHP